MFALRKGCSASCNQARHTSVHACEAQTVDAHLINVSHWRLRMQLAEFNYLCEE